MSREIKFRGLRTDGKGWIYGCLINNAFFNSKTKHSIPYIFNPEECDDDYGWEYFDDDYGYYEVIPETVGQFTGLTDKNGNDIYEGDLVNYKTIVKTDETGENITYKGEIQFWLGQVGCGWRYKSGRYTLMIKRSHACSMEIIGNIHEKGGKNEKH